MTTLVPMTEPEFAAFSVKVIAEYAAEKVASGEWTRGESPDLAAKALATLLPQGLATPDHHLFTIRPARDGPAVGVLWYAEQTRGGRRVAYVYDVYVDEAHQRQGHATGVFHALEAEALRRGLTGISLHVFGHNTGARALYERLGFFPTNITMFKPLPTGGG